MTTPPTPDARQGTDDVSFDHRGRARPMYAGRTEATGTWRPGRLARLSLGLFPGLRVMAVSSAVAGLPYMVLGLAALVLGGLLSLEWDIARQNAKTFHIREVYLLMHIGAILLAAVIFELLRFAAGLEEKYYGSRAPRLLAAFWLPAILVLFWGPSVARYWPRLVEALWVTAAFVALGSTPAAIWSAAEGFLMSHERLRRFQIGVAAGLLLIGGGTLAAVFGVASTRADVLAWSTKAGFVVLPRLLGG